MKKEFTKKRDTQMENGKTKICRSCNRRKLLFLFAVHNAMKDGISTKCKKCENRRQMEAREIAKDWVYPYKGVTDPKYLKDRNEMFVKHGNGWWWLNGWWNGHNDTVASRQRKYRDTYSLKVKLKR